ncbi:cell division protein SepF [Candidatus Weimeria sp. HCP3S3_B5]|jgi:cell division inhibitor SepF|uniref:cell division protein SepF n=1 Tax=Candidatus Weimeria sp. HCP3S3_B5 TaxID=3438871 RepID=UPI002AA05753|nr:cell division protein SepF [Lachnospiraceae bacterium]MDY6352557.1 cell division protein SepF [Lachnospiraceae bacterium]
MSIFDKFLDAVNLPSDDDEYDDEDYEETEEERPRRRTRDRDEAASSKITPIRSKESSQRRSYKAADGMAVASIKPTSYGDIQEIADTLISGTTILLNTEGLDMSVGQRIIDFVSGVCYAKEGNLQRVSNFIFLITPKDVTITGDFLQMVDNLPGSISSVQSLQ